MTRHKFRVGQMVGLQPSAHQTVSGLAREYKVLRLLPSLGGELWYRIKTITEACERVAKEGELVMHSSPWPRTLSWVPAH